MADVNAQADGQWGQTATWDTGVVPTAGQSVAIGEYTVSIENGTTTNDVGAITIGAGAGNGGELYIKTGGKLCCDGLITLVSNSEANLRMEGSAEIEFVSGTIDSTQYVYCKEKCNLYISSSSPITAPCKIHSRSSSTPCRYGIYFFYGGDIDIDGLWIYDINRVGIYYAQAFAQYSTRSIQNCLFHDIGSNALYGIGSSEISTFRNLCCYDSGSFANLAWASVFENVLIGYDLDGNAGANTTEDIRSAYRTHLYKNVFGGNTQTVNGVGSEAFVNCIGYNNSEVTVENKGYLVKDGIFATFPSTVSSPGETHVYTQSADISFSDATSSATMIIQTRYTARVDAYPIYINDKQSIARHFTIPVDGGDEVTISVSATLSDNWPADCVTVTLDPDSMYDGVNDTSTDTIASGATETLTATGTIPSGTYSANLDWRINITDSYAGSADSVTINSISIVVGTKRYSVNLKDWILIDEVFNPLKVTVNSITVS